MLLLALLFGLFSVVWTTPARSSSTTQTQMIQNTGEDHAVNSSANGTLWIPQDQQLKVRDNGDVVIDDMVFSREHWLRRSGMSSNSFAFAAAAADDARGPKLWPNNIVYFFFENENSYPSNALAIIRDVIRQTQDILFKETCLQLVESPNANAIKIVRSSQKDDCSSIVGYSTGHQIMELGDDCGRSFMHETMHALSFDHAHSRWDRDDHVVIHEQNIAEGHKNFLKSNDTYEGFRVANVEYDLGSIMSYSPTAFAKENTKTIEPKNRPWYMYTMGNRERFSFLDIKSINELYGCRNNKVNNPCLNGGYLANVGGGKKVRCNCPPGFMDGSHCTSPANDKKKYEVVTASPKKNLIAFTDDVFLFGNRFLEVVHIVKPPGAKHVVIEIVYINGFKGLCKYGCSWSYLEIKAFSNSKSQTGIRFCCPDVSYPLHYSSLDVTPIIFKRFPASFLDKQVAHIMYWTV